MNEELQGKMKEESDRSELDDTPCRDPTSFHLRTTDLCARMITLVEAEKATLQTMKEVCSLVVIVAVIVAVIVIVLV